MYHLLSTMVRTPQTSKSRLFLSLFIVTFLVFCCCYFFELRWRTNDDVAMSMIAHGYGIAKLASPNILFSNVLWGDLIRNIPSLNGVLGYSIMTLAVLTLAGITIFHGLSQMGGYITAFSLLLLIVFPAVLLPQFTINAGLLQVSAIICWCHYAKQKNWLTLITGCLLAYLSYLIRSQEFWLVLIISLPLLPWRTLSFRAPKIAFFILSLAIMISSAINYRAYQKEDWHAYKALNPARASFTDFGAGEYLKQHNEILTQNGYSTNDIDLISSCFFVDTHIANPQKLKIMLKQLGPLPIQERSLEKAWTGMKMLWSPPLLITVFTAFLLVLLRPSWYLVFSWGVCLAALFILGLLGRPGILHVYVPLISLLLVAPFIGGAFSVRRNYLSYGVLIFSAFLNTYNLVSEFKSQQINAVKTRELFTNFPKSPVVVWGGLFPYEFIYPVLKISSSAMSYKHFGLGTSTLAPFSFAYAKQKEGIGLTEALLQKEGISILADKNFLQLLSIYCKEHFFGKLEEIKSKSYGSINLSQQRCVKVQENL